MNDHISNTYIDDTKVSLTGDTMTGVLNMSGKNITLQATNLDLNGDNPSAATWANSGLWYTDQDGQRIGSV